MQKVIDFRRVAAGVIAVIQYRRVVVIESWDTIADDHSVIDTFEFSDPEGEKAAMRLALRDFYRMTADWRLN